MIAKSLFVFLLGCSQMGVDLSKEAQEIEVLGHRPEGCRAIGKFIGKDDSGTKELALNSALNDAAKNEATAVVVNQEIPNGKEIVVHVTGYKCD
jgi:hypothetical protein